MTATEMVKRIGVCGDYKAGGFTISVEIKDLMDTVGQGTMCLIIARGAKGQEWVPLHKVKIREEIE